MRFILLVFLCFVITCFAQKEKEPAIDLSAGYKENIDFVKQLNFYAADLFGDSLTQEEIEGSIKNIHKKINEIPSQKILLTDLILLYREQLLDKARLADLHFSIYSTDSFASKKKLPFCAIRKDKKLYVEYSETKKIRRGDEILSINNVPTDELLRYSYKWRHYGNDILLRRCHYMYSDVYEIEINRNNRTRKYSIKGVENCEIPIQKTKVFKEEKVGYFNLPNFTDEELPLSMSVFIDSLQQMGISDLIIDIRNNGGGNSNLINDFFSIMSNTPNYIGFRKAKIKVSPYTADFIKQVFGEYIDTLNIHNGDFIDTENMYSTLTKMVDVDTIDFFGTNLDFEKYKEGMRYYIWIGEDTGSTAAMFARCAQKNKFALLVGEPTQMNPDKYGNVISIPWNDSNNIMVSFSTTKFEYVFDYEPIIHPDVEILFNPKDLTKEGDPQIRELLKQIRDNR